MPGLPGGLLDDHSRFLVSCGLQASQPTAPVLEVFRASRARGAPPTPAWP